MTTRRWLNCLVLCVGSAVVAALPCGCGGSGPERAIVTGTVTFDGQPLASGRIRLDPTFDLKGPAISAAIQEGCYSLDARGGVPVGSYRVWIESFRPDPRVKTPPREGEGTPLEQIIPEKYNTKSELQITIEPGTKSIVRDFTLAR